MLSSAGPPEAVATQKKPHQQNALCRFLDKEDSA
jgi:hypothetical protein